MDTKWFEDCQKRRAQVEEFKQRQDAAFAHYYTCGHCARKYRADKDLICEVTNKIVGLDDPACNSIKTRGFQAFGM